MSIAVSAAPEAKLPAPAPASVCHAHKFGGSSLANVDRFRNVAALLRDEAASRVVIVSADLRRPRLQTYFQGSMH